ncbi:hypothetical protein [Mycolicibacterium smegmatis]|uniref:Uncharacterized protein n=3 Tax=Mycolicibacterium smegmatis TaxID=1772 RepID=I7FK06_MYCS2|nr:hypothetical protein [Mycolicibacterium smegmatis]ABK72948.1 hypothetical protein MSMEG_5363 [Mycolicibacterium smegmatis MC2 155]AFP41660.1 hypothetical protein MSMEI_5216 [Mycolicibacterium smegmatis MC2 155]AIU10389.1 hypothetical protein LJ00_26505 [Mycolicibacterium smegmatis MC2 155]AIU17014.1 hypothetical protein LI99_26510 [Mycolicibacterium smegmatis]AIU23637.1 hypothetical protein LI98_26515 [Mycolicibacterium smegmatis]
MSAQLITGQVAFIEDDYTLVLNRGSEAGVTPGMVFAVHTDADEVITDPESGRELGRLSREILQVRVFEVHPLFARAHTFVQTDDFYGLLGIPFVDQPEEHVVTVDVGDKVVLVPAEQHGLRRFD